MIRRFSHLVGIAALALSLDVGLARVAAAYPAVGGVLSHSRDDIPGGFTSLTGDDVVATPTMPFSVVIDGVSYNTVAISTNGWLEFGGNTAANSDPTNACLPTSKHTNPFLAFFWDNTRTINTAIRYGTVGTAGGRVFIIDADIEAVAGASHDVTLQVQIHEGSNLVTVKYDDTESESSGQSATIGYQGAGGSGATARGLTCNGRILDDNTPLDAWAIDLGLPQGTALSGYMVSSSDDISGFTTLSGDDVTANATIPFPVVIEGTSYTAVTISTNGWLEFGGNTSGNSDPTNDCLPSSAHTNPLLAMYWDDMRTINTAIRYGTVGSSPNRTFVIDADVENNNAGNNDVYWQVQIHEGGLITTKYVASQAEANGQTATIGFQGAGGAAATARSISCNAKVIDDNLPDEGWSIDLGAPHGSALLGVLSSSRDDLPALTTLTGDNATATATLPFTVTLEGVGYTTVALSTNGWMEFGGNTSANSDPSNVCLPTANHTNPFLAAYWDDLRTVGLAVRYGTIGSAGGRVFVADFEVENNFGSNHNMTMQVQVHERSSTITVKYLDAEDQANGQTATIGYQTAGGAAATGRSLTCNGKVLDDNAVRGEGWSVAQVEVCGDGLVTTGEQCDLGAQNGAGTSCCTSACAFRANGSTCRTSAGICDVVETCTGASATCPTNGFASTATVCRSSAGECDVADNCTGSGAACPSDAKQPGGTACTADANPCSLDQCDGSSSLCQHPAGNAAAVCRSASGICDVAETCTGASTTCPADGFAGTSLVCRSSSGECDLADTCDGTGADCPSDAKVPNGTGCSSDANPCTVDQCNGASDACQHPAGNAGAVCRPFAGTCDLPEVCTGADVDCPADDFLPNTVVCRSATGACDATENCTGSSGVCPADGVSSSGTTCRSAAGDCDVAESCDGVTSSCPADGFASSGTECRAANGACDVAEACTGASAACPGDGFAAGGTECRAAAGICDVADSCTGSGPDCPADSVAGAFVVCRSAVDVCDAPDTCDGVGLDCPPADVKQPTSTVCRPPVGPCDAPDFCDGANDACPAGDAKEPATTVCRPAAGVCDAPEHCDGSNDACSPVDLREPNSTVCRPAAGPCDAPDFCDGSDVDCGPGDAKEPTTTVCRSAAGVCDADDHCDGATNGCPADAKQPSSVICRSNAGACDVAETCTGASNACPADGFAASGTVCRSSTGVCDVAEACTGSSASCPSDSGAVDTDGDGTCDAEDSCPNVSDPGQPDGDGDGTGDACDPCTNVFNGGVFATKPKVIVTKLLTPPGDDKVKMKGYIVVPTTPTIEGDVNGLRILLQKQDGSYVFDTTLPAGGYDAIAKAGWKANGSRTKFTYKNAGNPTPYITGINKASIGVSTKTAGLVKFSVSGKLGSYGPIVQADLPLKATLVIDTPYATTGQCGETSFGPANCVVVSNGSTVKCQIK